MFAYVNKDIFIWQDGEECSEVNILGRRRRGLSKWVLLFGVNQLVQASAQIVLGCACTEIASTPSRLVINLIVQKKNL